MRSLLIINLILCFSCSSHRIKIIDTGYSCTPIGYGRCGAMVFEEKRYFKKDNCKEKWVKWYYNEEGQCKNNPESFLTKEQCLSEKQCF